jgi:hypothetical protein
LKSSSACGRPGAHPRRRRRAPRASALGCQRVGTGASDRSAGRVGTRLPSVPWTRAARPLACGRRGSLPGKPAEAERRFPECQIHEGHGQVSLPCPLLFGSLCSRSGSVLSSSRRFPCRGQLTRARSCSSR